MGAERQARMQTYKHIMFFKFLAKIKDVNKIKHVSHNSNI